MNNNKFANAYTEVYEILNCLEEQEYNKIPQELIDVFEENRNLNYEYKVNEEQDLTKQPMLKETKAILLNIFRDYLATSEQSEKIKRLQDEDRAILEKRKKEKYNNNVFENKQQRGLNGNKDDLFPSEISNKQTIFQNIVDKVKKIFKMHK